jgi:hypothetical protein
MHKWTEKEIRFIRAKIAGKSSMKMTELFNRHFGTDIKVSQMVATMQNYRIHSGVPPRFQPGNVPYNKGFIGFTNGRKPGRCYPIGTERCVCKGGYVEVKVADPRVWKQKHTLIWEAANGPVPNGCLVIFADRNKSNFALDNLLLVSRSELLVMNRQGLISPNASLTKTGKLIADVKIAIADRKRSLKRCRRAEKQNISRRNRGA